MLLDVKETIPPKIMWLGINKNQQYWTRPHGLLFWDHSPVQVSAQIGHDLKWFCKRRLLFSEKATFTKFSVSKEVKG